MKTFSLDGIKPRGFNTRGAAAYTGWSEAYFRRARIGKTKTPGPRFMKHGRRVTYLIEDLDTWLEQPEGVE